jgi:hypothetical protein
MAMTKGNIKDGDPEKGQSGTVTEEVPSEADATSAPGPYVDEKGDALDVNRPPVSTNDPEQPIAQSLVAGAGEPSGEPEIHPETHVAANAYVTEADKDRIVPVDAPPTEKPASKSASK